MWLVLDKGFVSIVEYKYDPSLLLVRSRVPEDIANIFRDDVEIEDDPTADYRYRATISRDRVAERLREAVMALDYESHFKEVAVDRSSDADPSAPATRYGAYMDTWGAFSRLQPTRPYGGPW